MKKVHIQGRVQPALRRDVALLGVMYRRTTSEMVEILLGKGIAYLTKDLRKYKRQNNIK